MSHMSNPQYSVEGAKLQGYRLFSRYWLKSPGSLRLHAPSIYTLGVKNEEYPPLMCNTLAEIISESLLGPERSEPIPEWFSSVVDSLVAEFNDDAEMGADYARRP